MSSRRPRRPVTEYEQTLPAIEYHEIAFKVIPPHGSGPVRTVTTQIAVNYKRVMELLYSHPVIPWQTESDVLRAFIDDGCAKYGPALAGKVVPGLLHQIKMMNNLIEQARAANDLAQSIDQLDHEAQRLIDGGMRETAVGLVYHYREQAKTLKEFDRVLSRKLVADINQRFAYLLKGDQGRKAHERSNVRIGPDEEED